MAARQPPDHVEPAHVLKNSFRTSAPAYLRVSFIYGEFLPPPSQLFTTKVGRAALPCGSLNWTTPLLSSWAAGPLERQINAGVEGGVARRAGLAPGGVYELVDQKINPRFKSWCHYS